MEKYIKIDEIINENVNTKDIENPRISLGLENPRNIGFKATGDIMNSLYGNFNYKMMTKYHTAKELKMCKNGFHFCHNLEDIFNYYDISTSRFYIIEFDEDNVITIDDKSITNNIKFIQEIITSSDYYIDYLINNTKYGEILLDNINAIYKIAKCRGDISVVKYIEKMPC